MANLQPDIEVMSLGTIHAEICPILKYNDLTIQSSPVLVSTADSGHSSTPKDEPTSSRKTANERARVIVAHEGYLRQDHIREVVGGGNSPISDGTAKMFQAIQAVHFGELYGNSSFLMQSVRGTYCTVEMRVRPPTSNL
jgi:hypothetical protein